MLQGIRKAQECNGNYFGTGNVMVWILPSVKQGNNPAQKLLMGSIKYIK